MKTIIQNAEKINNVSISGGANTINKGFDAEAVAQIVAAAHGVRDKQSIDAITQAIKAIGTTNATPSQIKAALEALQIGDTKKATALFEKETERGEIEAKQTAEAYRNLGALAYLDDTQKALKAYRRATQLDPDNPVGWNRLATLLLRVGELDTAISTYQTVLYVGQECKDQEAIAAAYGNMGIVWKTRGDLNKAIEYYNKALEIYENIGHKEGMANQYGNLGLVYSTHEDLDKAVECYSKALQLNKVIGRKEGMAIQHGNIGLIYKIRGDFSKAIKCYNMAAEEFEAIGYKEGVAHQYDNLGEIYLIMNNLSESLLYSEKSFELFRSIGNKEGMALCYRNFGFIYEKHKNYQKARYFLEQSICIYKSMQALGNPDAQVVQISLDRIPPEK